MQSPYESSVVNRPEPSGDTTVIPSPSEPPATEPPTKECQTDADPSPLHGPVRFALGYAGVLLPIICHLLTINAPPDQPTWQSGELSAKWAYILSLDAGWPAFPFLAVPIVCLTMLLFYERRFARNRLVRWGMYSGVPVAGWYAVVFAVTVGDVNGIAGLFAFGFGSVVVIAFAWGVVRALLWLRQRWQISWRVVGAAGTALGLLVWVAAAIVANVNEPASDFLVAFGGDLLKMPVGLIAAICFASLIFSTYWCFAAYAGMSARLALLYPLPLRFRLLDLMAWISWLAAFMAACRWSITLSLAEYAKLPLENPGDCYIASSAAKGHPWLVGSRARRTVRGKTVRVNEQLAVFKAGELALRCLLPRLHRGMRCVYDRVGPSLSRRMCRAWHADVAFCALKPLEWSTRLALHCLLGSRAALWIDRLYRGR